MGQKLFGWLLMASIIAWLGTSGCQDATGQPVASGRVWFFDPGTNNQQTVWKDATETATWTQPVPLDAGGRATVYAKNVVDIKVETSLGASVQTIAGADVVSSSMVSVDPAYMTGPYLSDTLIAANTSFGGPDFKYVDASGATPMSLKTWMSGVRVDVKAYGAKGDGLAIDTSAIQTAINRVSALGGGVVGIPPGVFLIDAALVIPSANIFIVGSGSGAAGSVIKQTNLTANGIQWGAMDYCGVEKLRITSSGTSTGIGISVGTGFPLRPMIEQVTVGGFNTGVQGAGVNLMIIEDSVVSGAVVGVAYTLGSQNCTIRGGQITGGASGAVTYNACSNNVIYGARISGTITFTNAVTTFGGSSVRDCTRLASDGGANAFTVVGTDPGLVQSGNGVDGYTEAAVAAGANVPSLYKGNTVTYTGSSGGGAYTINVPALAPTLRGVVMKILLVNVAAAGSWTFGAGFKRSVTAVSLLINRVNTLTFEYDVVNAVWRETSLTDTPL